MDAELLVVTADPSLREDAARWAAAVGAEPSWSDDPSSVRHRWVGADAVLVGADVVAELAASAPARRDHVLVVGPGAGDDVWRHAVTLGAVAVLDRAEESAVLSRLGEALDGRGEACLVTLTGAVGGIGTSTLAGATAARAVRRGLGALLLDADPLGAGLDLLLGAEHAAGLRWGALDAADGHIGADRLSRLLPRADDVAVLTHERVGDADVDDRVPVVPGLPVQAVPGVLTAATRAFDVVVADVPRRPDPLCDVVLSRASGAVLLVPEDVRGVAAARQVLPGLRERAPAVMLLSVCRPHGLGAAALTEALRLPVVARVRHDRRLPARLDHAVPPERSRTVRRAADAVLDLLGLGARS